MPLPNRIRPHVNSKLAGSHHGSSPLRHVSSSNGDPVEAILAHRCQRVPFTARHAANIVAYAITPHSGRHRATQRTSSRHPADVIAPPSGRHHVIQRTSSRHPADVITSSSGRHHVIHRTSSRHPADVICCSRRPL